ncbi:3-hydroxyisobutyrate dehydrogenase-like beta-hydroxyacid dehydrogenase [Variovorax sp. TBS-050B]|uniref:NAD(P)-dependent oxidoreductase n=1 Tax=Variovorax sp. TBS-050B TaxID=2940551 RepID=UPI0024734251|nr:NAD(P)-dependent oxidoreductase [Variovorax sp. TBS-050B]MDH6593829.1 3-hydroxyisobutyrate dehydrogenase-like beta-hydroxyacid dehydrogenase [Variovorax sp. TBS-050B]
MNDDNKRYSIGMVGIGLMGHGIASNLVKHGHALTVLEHPGNQPLDALRAAGATSVASLADLARGAEVLILCVTGSPQVEAVVLGEGGLLSGMKPGTIVIDCSTAIPGSTERVAQAVERAGGRFLDAPMTRTPREAAEGRLNLLVGGDAALLETCRPILSCFAENIVHTGAVGTGHGMKLLHNYVSLGTVALIAEAAACAQRAGVEPAVFVDVLAKGGGGGVALERLRSFITQQDPSGLRFAMSNAQKDLGYYAEMAGGAGAAHAIADAVLGTYAGAVQQGGAQRFVPELVALLAERGEQG